MSETSALQSSEANESAFVDQQLILNEKHSLHAKMARFITKAGYRYNDITTIPEQFVPDDLRVTYNATSTFIIPTEIIDKGLSLFDSFEKIFHDVFGFLTKKRPFQKEVYHEINWESLWQFKIGRYFFVYPDLQFPQLVQIILVPKGSFDYVVANLSTLQLLNQEPKTKLYDSLEEGFHEDFAC